MAVERPYISVVVPLYNEAENLDDLHREMSAALESMGRTYELVLVDDGSTDGTRQRLLSREEADPRVRVVLLRRNFGQTAAFSAGFDRAEGEEVTLDVSTIIGTGSATFVDAGADGEFGTADDIDLGSSITGTTGLDGTFQATIISFDVGVYEITASSDVMVLTALRESAVEFFLSAAMARFFLPI